MAEHTNKKTKSSNASSASIRSAKRTRAIVPEVEVRGRPTNLKLSPAKKELLYAEVRRTGNFAASCRLVSISPTRGYHIKSPQHKDYDSEFSERVREAEDEWIAALEQEAQERARGRDELVIHGGRVISHKGKPVTTRKASDLLMMFLLKAHRPEMYHDAVRVAGHDGGPMSPADVDPRAALLSKLGREVAREPADDETDMEVVVTQKSAGKKKVVTRASLLAAKKRNR